MEHSKTTGSYVDLRAGRVTFREYAEDRRAIQAHHRQTTAEDVERQLRLHVYPSLGHRPIGAVLPSEIQALVRAYRPARSFDHRGGPQTDRGGVSRRRWDRLIASSPAVEIKLPRKPPTSTLLLLTTEQVAALSDAINPHPPRS